jgi:hypothetical protein
MIDMNVMVFVLGEGFPMSDCEAAKEELHFGTESNVNQIY